VERIRTETDSKMEKLVEDSLVKISTRIIENDRIVKTRMDMIAEKSTQIAEKISGLEKFCLSFQTRLDNTTLEPHMRGVTQYLQVRISETVAREIYTTKEALAKEYTRLHRGAIGHLTEKYQEMLVAEQSSSARLDALETQGTQATAIERSSPVSEQLQSKIEQAVASELKGVQDVIVKNNIDSIKEQLLQAKSAEEELRKRIDVLEMTATAEEPTPPLSDQLKFKIREMVTSELRTLKEDIVGDCMAAVAVQLLELKSAEVEMQKSISKLEEEDKYYRSELKSYIVSLKSKIDERVGQVVERVIDSKIEEFSNRLHEFEEKVAIVSQVGREIKEKVQELGYKVGIIGKSGQEVQETVQELERKIGILELQAAASRSKAGSPTNVFKSFASSRPVTPKEPPQMQPALTSNNSTPELLTSTQGKSLFKTKKSDRAGNLAASSHKRLRDETETKEERKKRKQARNEEKASSSAGGPSEERLSRTPAAGPKKNLIDLVAEDSESEEEELTAVGRLRPMD
jgi:hypothetical protein